MQSVKPALEVAASVPSASSVRSGITRLRALFAEAAICRVLAAHGLIMPNFVGETKELQNGLPTQAQIAPGLDGQVQMAQYLADWIGAPATGGSANTKTGYFAYVDLATTCRAGDSARQRLSTAQKVLEDA